MRHDFGLTRFIPSSQFCATFWSLAIVFLLLVLLRWMEFNKPKRVSNFSLSLSPSAARLFYHHNSEPSNASKAADR